jgi:hypothetical protein
VRARARRVPADSHQACPRNACHIETARR